MPMKLPPRVVSSPTGSAPLRQGGGLLFMVVLAAVAGLVLTAGSSRPAPSGWGEAPSGRDGDEAVLPDVEAELRRQRALDLQIERTRAEGSASRADEATAAAARRGRAPRFP